MNSENVQLIQVEAEGTAVTGVSFSEVFRNCLKHWAWFLVSLVVCLTLGVYKVLSTKPVYSRSALVLIKQNESRRVSASDLEAALLSSSGQIASKVANEVIAFRSLALMRDVVNRLDLCTEYAFPGFFRDRIVYGSQVPVKVNFIDVPSEISSRFVIALLPDGKGCSISKMIYYVKDGKYQVSDTYEVPFGDTLNTEIGKLRIVRNELFSEEWNSQLLVSRWSLNGATDRFSKNFSVMSEDAKSNTDVVRLSLYDNSVQRADDILQTVIAIYNENWVSDKNKMAVSTSGFINERLAALQSELGDIDENISSYQSENLIPDLNSLSDVYVSQNMDNMKNMQELENQLYVYRFLQKYLSENSSDEQLIPMSGGLSNLGVSGQIQEYNEMLLSRNGILANSSGNNPLVGDLNGRLVSMRSSISASVDNQIKTIKSQLEYMRSRERALTSKIAESPTQAKYLMTVGREQKVKEELYLFMLQKREENELSQAFSAYNTRVITPPMGEPNKTAPKTLRCMLITLLLGLFVPFAVVYLITLFDTKIHSKKDLENISVPFLGEIPQYSAEESKSGFMGLNRFRKETNANDILVKEGQRDIINEAFRVLRTNLEYMIRENGKKVMLVTSFNPGSGKSFISMNLGMVISLKKKKVLLIDADMRHASLSDYVNRPKKGLSTYLSGGVSDYHDLLCRVEGNESLFVMPAGSNPPNPTELIGEPGFAALIEQARKEYDIVLVDCPPIDMVADTQIISQVVDRTLFVVRANLLEKAMVPQLDRLEDTKNLKGVCVVLNGTSSLDGVYGSKYGYYGSKYNYYYHDKA